MQNTYKFYLKKEPAYSNENSVNLFTAWSTQFQHQHQHQYQHQHQHQHYRGTCITLSGLYSFVSTSSSKLTCVDLDQTRLVNRKIYLVSLYQKRNGWWTKKKRFSEICFPHPATIKTRWQASVHLGVGTWKRFSLSGFDDISRWRN